MLRQRVITAVVLLLIFLPSLFYPTSTPFCMAALMLIAAGGWEWAKLNGYRQSVSLLSGVLCACACAAAWRLGALEQTLGPLWSVSSAAWVLAGGLVLYRGVGPWGAHPRMVRLGLGLCALWLAWVAVAQARMIGTNFLLSVLLLVWVADIFAYFAGRTFGGRVCKRKLAPSISPGKSWEGVWGGMLGVVCLAFVWRWLDSAWQVSVPSLYSRIGAKGTALLVVAVLFMTLMSVVGDLLESLVKRSAGVKDSSGLLPGHGGVLDRVDALLPTLPLAMMLYSA